ncbi:MAG: A/G-specific adenine glycosylase [Chloroflexota bacterium]
MSSKSSDPNDQNNRITGRSRGKQAGRIAPVADAAGESVRAGTDSDAMPGAEVIATVQERLRSWFRIHGRDLPWRKTRDPYHILVAEIMLQQTQVERVLPYYAAFLERFPTLQALAQASPADVIRLWGGLGYNRRAVNLQRVAQHIVQQHGGHFPCTVEELRRLPGIGPYTAGAIACFAFEQAVPFLDTNIRRVLHRVFVGPDVPRPRVSEATLVCIAARAVPPDAAWEWNQAVMEFGAVHCTARKPTCSVCPVQTYCQAFPAILTVLQTVPTGARKTEPAPFVGSTRWYRGRILAALRAAPPAEGLSLRAIGQQIREDFTDRDLPWLRDLVEGLARDGLAVAEDSPTYDASPPDPSSQRIRLPGN